MKLGEFITHARLFGQTTTKEWLRKGFSRISDKIAATIIANAKLPKSTLTTAVSKISEENFRKFFEGLQATDLPPPPTTSVMSVGEESLAMSIQRLGEIDYFSVVSRNPAICDFKPVQVEVALARLQEKSGEGDQPVQVLRFANRVPLQFDKASCAIVKAINSVNWKLYGLRQSRGQLPYGPYIIAVSVVSPFIKFKNASKETIDASDELVEEIRKALMKAGQRLSRHLRREHKAEELETKIQHIEKFSPILVATLVRILEAPEKRRTRAEEGLRKILGRDAAQTEKQLSHAEVRLNEHLESRKKRFKGFQEEDVLLKDLELVASMAEVQTGEKSPSSSSQTAAKKTKKPKSRVAEQN
jgi:DNA topoisomerase-6 subunit B